MPDGSPRRAPALVALAALLVAGGVADRAARSSPPAGRGGPPPYVQPVAARAGALASTWYCVGATATPDGRANGRIEIVNVEARDVTGRVTVFPSEGERRTVPFEVKGRSSARLGLTDVLQAPAAAALVETDAGGIGVELTVEGPTGRDDQPCHAGASTEWVVPDGTTVKDAALTLAVFNPFPGDAVVDLTFATDEGRVTPPAFQAVLVPAGGLVHLDVGAHVQRKNEVATFVEARQGRVAVSQVQVLDGSAGRTGLALVPAAPSAGDAWHFPEGYVTDGIVERVAIVNPSATEAAEVDVDIVLEGTDAVAEPVSLSIPPRARVTFSANDPAVVPARVPHALAVRSLNGVGVVAGRTIEAANNDRRGLSMMLGSRLFGSRWAFAVGGPNDVLDHWLVFENPEAVPVTVKVTGLADGQLLAVEGLQEVRLGPGARTAVRLGNHVRRDLLPIVVSATGPIVVERGVYRAGGAVGTSTSLGILLP